MAISAGTNFTPAAEDTYPGLQTEIETLVRDVGMTPSDAIRAATSTAARAFKADGEMGTLTAGKLANLVIVSRNPLDDITALREVVLTVKRGRAYPRSDYHQPSAEALGTHSSHTVRRWPPARNTSGFSPRSRLRPHTSQATTGCEVTIARVAIGPSE